jgi:hypothetical protein
MIGLRKCSVLLALFFLGTTPAFAAGVKPAPPIPVAKPDPPSVRKEPGSSAKKSEATPSTDNNSSPTLNEVIAPSTTTVDLLFKYKFNSPFLDPPGTPGLAPIKPSVGIPNADRPHRTDVPKSPRERAEQDFKSERSKDHPDLIELLRLGQLAEKDPGSVSIELSKRLAQSKGEFKNVPFDSDWPNLLVLRPVDSSLDAVVDYMTVHVRSLLNRRVDREQVLLLPLTFSSDAPAALNEKVPLSRRALDLEARISGDFKEVSDEMFSSLRGKTLVVIGHVENINGDAAFEVQRAGRESLYIPLKAILGASKRVGFNFVPLGCDTSNAMGVGTTAKINDLDAIEAFRKAMGTGTTAFGALLSDLSSTEQLHFTINLQKLEDGSTVPIDVVDKDGRTLNAFPSLASSQQAPRLSQLGALSSGTPVIVQETALFESRPWRHWIEDWWFKIYRGLLVVGFSLAFLELFFLRAVPIDERVWGFVYLAFFGGMAAFMIGVFFDQWLVGEPPWGQEVLVLALSVPALMNLASTMPDHRLARLSAAMVLFWSQIPLLINLSIFCLALVNLHPFSL